MTGSIALDPTIAMAIRYGLAALLLQAGVHKLRDLAGFRDDLEGYDLLPGPSVRAVALLLPPVELATALGLALSGDRLAPAGAAGLLGLYAGAIAINLARGRRHIDCGCYGPGERRVIGGWMVLRNALLVCVALLACLPAAPRAPGWLDITIALAAGATAFLLYQSIDLVWHNRHLLHGGWRSA